MEYVPIFWFCLSAGIGHFNAMEARGYDGELRFLEEKKLVTGRQRLGIVLYGVLLAAGLFGREDVEHMRQTSISGTARMLDPILELRGGSVYYPGGKAGIKTGQCGLLSGRKKRL